MNQIFLLIGGLGAQELLILLAILLLLFGSTRLPQLAKGLGKSIREFKKGVNETGETEESESPPRRESLRAESNRIEDERLPASEATVNKPR